MMTFRKYRIATFLMLGAASPAFFTPAAQAADDRAGTGFNVQTGPLDDVLTQIALQARLRIIFDPALVRNRTAPAIRGRMTPEAAIRRALDGSSLALRGTPDGQWLVTEGKAQAPTVDGKVLGTVRVTASTQSGENADPDGGSGSIVTEGTGSYTTHAATVASKQALALKDTPQAVSVVTRQQLDDRAVVSFSDSLNALAGVNVTADGFYARGFQITNIQIDGGSPLAIGRFSNFSSSYNVMDDLSIYDSVSMQRGSAGMFTGIGEPSGVISLERKRPLDHAALNVTTQAGSWQKLRGVVDASSPAYFDGKLRVRGVLTGERNDYFYDTASRRFWQAYVNAELRPFDGTTVNIGGKISRDRDTPFSGLPTDSDGKLMDLPRDTCFCTSWSLYRTRTREVFAQLSQRLSADWTLKLNGSANWQQRYQDALGFTTDFGTFGVVPGAVDSGTFSVVRGPSRSNQKVVDGFLSGKFRLLGIPAEVTLGANYQLVNQQTSVAPSVYYYYGTTTLPFDPAAFARPADDEAPGYTDAYYPIYRQRQLGAYATVRLSPLDWLHLTIGERYAGYNTEQVRINGFDNSSTRIAKKIHNWSFPNLGVVADISGQLSAFASYASIFDQYRYVNAAGEPLPPQTGSNVEAGLKAALGHGRLNLSGSAFHIKVRNQAVFQPGTDPRLNPIDSSECCFVSDGSAATRWGLDFQVQGAITNRFSVDLSYTFTHYGRKEGPIAADTPSLPILRSIPEHLGKLWAAWRVPVLEDRLTLGFGGQVESSVEPYSSGYAFMNGGWQQVTVSTHRPGYVRAVAMAKFALSPRFDVQVNVDNIFDRTYYNTVNTGSGNFYGAPRSVLLTLTGKL